MNPGDGVPHRAPLGLMTPATDHGHVSGGTHARTQESNRPRLDHPDHATSASALPPIDPDLDEIDPSAPGVGSRRGTRQVDRSEPRVLAAIAVGGFLGTVARYGVGQSFAVAPEGFPWTTFAINTSGAFVLGGS